ncbi:Y-family DNA polymerase [Granulicatella seriolae]|uniref:Y-family DNA polymerase n=1 Tax=Granulicatella seriolae TaxID=2967226 RepID=A0ABT1WMC2_9LACT|nr:Y-family DNA polymerase [Granulicatella seriolae]
MGWIDYSREPKSDIAFFDMKSFYASVECVDRGLHPLTTSLCVMSRADHTNGLILASSPTFKKVFGRDNVGRSNDLPFDMKTRKFRWAIAKKQGIEPTADYIQFIESWAKQTWIVPPRMGLYIQRNLEIQEIFQNYAPKEEILPYSIDEGFIDLTRSLPYFIKDKSLSQREKLDLLSRNIQHDIWTKTGVYSTVGMSNANPLLAKLALDNEAKHTKSMRANWSYEDVETKVWKIEPMTDFWGIGHRTERRLKQMGIYTIKDLANTNPDLLKKEFGLIGLQLFFHANGVDESKVIEPYQAKSTGLGNAQILPKDYVKQRDIELVLSEMAEQVAIRLRKRHRKATVVSIYIGFSRQERRKSISVQKKIEPSQSSRDLTNHVLSLFRKNYSNGAVRNISVRYDGLVDENYTILSLFDDIEEVEKQERLEKTVDDIRDKFGYLSIQKANSLLESSRSVARSKLIGGHSAGGLDGLT